MRPAPIDLLTNSADVMTATPMRKWILIGVAIIACLALVAVVGLIFWFGLTGIGGGTTSVGETSVQYVSISPDNRLNLVFWSDNVSATESSSESGLFGSSMRAFFRPRMAGVSIGCGKHRRKKGVLFRSMGLPMTWSTAPCFLCRRKVVRFESRNSMSICLRFDRLRKGSRPWRRRSQESQSSSLRRRARGRLTGPQNLKVSTPNNRMQLTGPAFWLSVG